MGDVATASHEAKEREEKLGRLGQHWVSRREQREETQRGVETTQAKEQRVETARKEAQKKVTSLVAQDLDTQRTFFVKMNVYLWDAMAVLDVMLVPRVSQKDVPRLGALRGRTFSCNKELVEEQTRELQEEEGDSETRDTMMTIVSLGLDEAMSIHRELVELVRLDTVP